MQVSKKVQAVCANSMRPLVCIGEDRQARTTDKAMQVVLDQARTALAHLDSNQRTKCLLAYEPIWAIGVNGTPATVAQVQTMVSTIKANFPDVPVLYGGSVDATNARELCLIPELDGLFIGRAALAATSFLQLVDEAIAGASARIH